MVTIFAHLTVKWLNRKKKKKIYVILSTHSGHDSRHPNVLAKQKKPVQETKQALDPPTQLHWKRKKEKLTSAKS